MAGVGPALVVFHYAVVVGLRHNHARDIAGSEHGLEGGAVGHAPVFGYYLDCYAGPGGICGKNLLHGRSHSRSNEYAALFAHRVDGHKHGFGGCRRAVVHRRVAYVEPGKLGHHTLVFKYVL